MNVVSVSINGAEANGKRGSAYWICHKCLGYNELVNLLPSVLTDGEDYSLLPGFNRIIAGNSFSRETQALRLYGNLL